MGEQEQGVTGHGLPQAVFWGFRYAVLLLVIGILLMGILYIAGMDWTGHMRTVYDYLCYAGVVLGAFLTGHRLKTRGWLGGIILALVYGLFLLLLAKIFGRQLFKISMVKMILVLLGLVGGFWRQSDWR